MALEFYLSHGHSLNDSTCLLSIALKFKLSTLKASHYCRLGRGTEGSTIKGNTGARAVCPAPPPAGCSNQLRKGAVSAEGGARLSSATVAAALQLIAKGSLSCKILKIASFFWVRMKMMRMIYNQINVIWHTSWMTVFRSPSHKIENCLHRESFLVASVKGACKCFIELTHCRSSNPH